MQRESFHNVLVTNPNLGLHVTEALTAYVVRLVQLVSDLSLRTVEARLAQRLMEQAEMAARLGTKTDVVGRALHKLGEEKIIRVERQRVWILDREGLAAKPIVES